MTNEPLISVIVPVYNVEKYLARCIESILNQSYINLEIILVDDGSTDSSGKICDEYAADDKRIYVIHKENGGQSTARNAALDCAKGEYITFVDSDDYIHTDFIKIMYETIIAYDGDIVQCDYIRGTEDVFPNIPMSGKCKLIDVYTALSSFIYKVIPCAKLYKKSAIGMIRFPEGKINEDDATYYKFAYNCKRICILENRMYYYYMSPNSTMRNNDKPRLDFLSIYEERISFFKEKNDEFLLQKSYERFAIVLALKYAHYIKDDVNRSVCSILKDKFDGIYNKSKESTSFKYRVLLYLFYRMPKITGHILAIVQGY